jgi:adenine-specific DNA methylase
MKKKLIEVALPLEAINKESAREKGECRLTWR